MMIILLRCQQQSLLKMIIEAFDDFKMVITLSRCQNPITCEVDSRFKKCPNFRPNVILDLGGPLIWAPASSLRRATLLLSSSSLPERLGAGECGALWRSTLLPDTPARRRLRHIRGTGSAATLHPREGRLPLGGCAPRLRPSDLTLLMAVSAYGPALLNRCLHAMKMQTGTELIEAAEHDLRKMLTGPTAEEGPFAVGV